MAVKYGNRLFQVKGNNELKFSTHYFKTLLINLKLMLTLSQAFKTNQFRGKMTCIFSMRGKVCTIFILLLTVH